MGDKITAQDILESYEEITIKQRISDSAFLINLFGKEFLVLCPDYVSLRCRPQIFLYNDPDFDFPHIMLWEEEMGEVFPKGTYRFVCLYEQESVVNSLMSFEEKIRDAIGRLIRLLKMNQSSREKEFKKEFMFYWNGTSNGDCVSVYLMQDEFFSKMEAYFSDTEKRLIEKNINLSDLNARKHQQRIWQHHLEIRAYSVPIIDNREILPPHRGYNWDVDAIKNIIHAKEINHISQNTYEQITNEIITTRDAILVFTMDAGLSKVTFAIKINFKNNSEKSLMEKICEDGISVDVLKTVRKDYNYLSEQIGNDIGLRNKRVLLIGCGSLGSYVSLELVKNGASSLTLYDGDTLEDANILRWFYGGVGIGDNKAFLLGYLSDLLHPEVHVSAKTTNIDEEMLVEEMTKSDIIIFTIGNSDSQLEFNKILKQNECQIPVIYAWLEAGGEYSHILTVDYKKAGCYECLYTGDDGELINNRASINSDVTLDQNILRNGCGGTRAAYGSAVLLRTTAVLLNTIQNLLAGEIDTNLLIDITPEKIDFPENIIPAKRCKCCGTREDR